MTHCLELEFGGPGSDFSEVSIMGFRPAALGRPRDSDQPSRVPQASKDVA
jgi:hypothetical protein